MNHSLQPYTYNTSFTHSYTHTHTSYILHSCTHLNIPVGQQQVHNYIRGEQLYTVQAVLDATQLLTQGFPAEPLPCHLNLMPGGLPEVLAVSTKNVSSNTAMIFN